MGLFITVVNDGPYPSRRTPTPPNQESPVQVDKGLPQLGGPGATVVGWPGRFSRASVKGPQRYDTGTGGGSR